MAQNQLLKLFRFPRFAFLQLPCQLLNVTTTPIGLILISVFLIILLHNSSSSLINLFSESSARAFINCSDMEKRIAPLLNTSLSHISMQPEGSYFNVTKLPDSIGNMLAKHVPQSSLAKSVHIPIRFRVNTLC